MIAFVVLWCEIQEVVLKASDWTSPGLDGNGTLYLWREMKSLGWYQTNVNVFDQRLVWIINK